ncbi:MAG: UDP-glucose/GDP-mannose dehydrogenase family protein, partial [Aldersonia sp.]|nr:UDP-glucose/GDP-mannose dehydrogenase family protein [Aldersonia sp.]
MRVGVVGAGYVGLTTAAGLAHLGHRVHAVDVDEGRVAELDRGEVSLPEPELGPLVRAQNELGRLSFGTDMSELSDCEVVFVCVPTPMGEVGAADLGAVYDTAELLARTLRPGAIVVSKSTVPVGTAAQLEALLSPSDIRVVSNPEFLRESHAVEDFLHPDRIVIGAAQADTGDRVAALFRSIDAPVQRVGLESAELAKYASNAFLAVKLSFVNELAELCENVGADIRAVSECMGLDPRIGPAFLNPGPGGGGSCHPKDTAAQLHL